MAKDDLNLKRELLEQLRELKRIRKQAVRKGRPDNATAATAQMVQIAKMLADLGETAAGAKAQTPGCCRNCGAKIPETVWKVSYEDPGAQPEELNAQAIGAVRSALGFRDKVSPTVWADRDGQRRSIVSSLAGYFGVTSDSAEHLVAELEKISNWEEEINVQTPLLEAPTEARDED
jgi:hypothetical protein